MGKLISLFGIGRGGKSTIAINVAVELAKKGHLVCVFNANPIYGSIQRYININVPKEKSLTLALAKPHENVISECIIHDQKLNIFIMSLSNEDDVMALTEIDSDNAISLIIYLKNKFDYLIVDGTDRPNDILMHETFGMAEKIIEVVIPTIQGITYHNAHKISKIPVISPLKYSLVFNGYKPFISKADILENCNGEPVVDIPYSILVEESENSGEPICFRGKEKKYNKAILLLVDLIEGNDNQKKDKKKNRQ